MAHIEKAPSLDFQDFAARAAERWHEELRLFFRLQDLGLGFWHE